MKFNVGRGVKGVNVLSNELLSSNDLNALSSLNYQNLTDLLGVMGSKFGSVDCCFGGARVSHTSGLLLSVSAGTLVSYSGYYDESFTFVPSVGDVFSVLIPDSFSVSIATNVSGTYDRYDVIEVRPVLQSYDSKTRQFRDPVTGLVSSALTNVKSEFTYEFHVLQGNASVQNYASPKTAGWIKIAEVCVVAGSIAITPDGIRDYIQSHLWLADTGSIVSNDIQNSKLVTISSDTVLTNSGLYLVDGFYTVTLPALLNINDIIEITAGSMGCVILQSDAENIVVAKNGLSTVKGITGQVKLLPNQTVVFVYLGSGTYLSNTLSELTFPATGITNAIRSMWSPDGTYLAVCFDTTSPNTKWYKRTGDTLSELTFPVTGITKAYGLAWSPDGIYLAVAFDTTSPNMQLYKRTGDTLTLLTFPATGIINAYYTSWSPNGTYLAVIFDTTSPNLQIYKRTSDTLTLLTTVTTGIGTGRAVEWSPDGNYLAVCFATTSPNVQFYALTGDTLTLLTFPATGISTARAVSWSPDGKYLAVAFQTTSPNTKWYKRIGDTLSELTFPATGITNAMRVAWSPDGAYLAVSFYTTSPNMKLYKRTGDTLTLLTFPVTGITQPASLSWTPDGNYLVVAFYTTSPNTKWYKFYLSAGKKYLIQVDSDDNLPLKECEKCFVGELSDKSSINRMVRTNIILLFSVDWSNNNNLWNNKTYFVHRYVVEEWRAYSHWKIHRRCRWKEDEKGSTARGMPARRGYDVGDCQNYSICRS